MTKSENITLEKAVEAARNLPDEAQRELASEMMEWVEEYSTPGRPKTRQDIIRERMSKSLKSISRDDHIKMLRKYNPAL